MRVIKMSRIEHVLLTVNIIVTIIKFPLENLMIDISYFFFLYNKIFNIEQVIITTLKLICDFLLQ